MDPNLKFVCAALSVFLSTIAFIPYTIDVWKIKSSEDVRPTISGWVSWGLSDMAILAAMIASEAVSWQMASYVGGQFIVIALSLRKGLKIAEMRGEAYTWRAAFMDWGRKDTICVAIVAAAVGVWAIWGDPDHAIFLTLISTVIGTWAIVVNLRKDPYREPLVPWLLFLAGGIFGVIAIPIWNFAGASAPLLFLGVQLTMVSLCLRRFQTQHRCAKS